MQRIPSINPLHGGFSISLHLQHQMTLDSLFKLLLLNADVPLRDCGGAVLQELLDKDDIVAVVIVNLCCVELAEAVRADILTVTQIGTNALQPLLHSSFGDGKYPCLRSDIVVEAIAADELIKGKGHGKGSGFLCLLFHNGQTISVSIMYDISKAQFDDIGNAQSKVGFEYQGGCDALIWSASGKALLHGSDDCLVLLSGYSDGFLVHGMPPDG